MQPGAVSVSDPLRGRSEALRAFVTEMPWERESIVAFVAGAAAATPPGAHVIDVGAGDAPYRELFGHTDYVTVDWSETVHEAPDGLDVVASADALPLAAGAADVLLCTQVLEHVAEPAPVLAELRRVLAPGGTLYLTAPLVWEEHELPHDYFRYTRAGLEHLLSAAGFESIEVAPRSDCFTTLAQLLSNARWAMGRAPQDGLDPAREHAAARLLELAEEVAAFAPLDAQHLFPLGYAVRATAPHSA